MSTKSQFCKKCPVGAYLVVNASGSTVCPRCGTVHHEVRTAQYGGVGAGGQQGGMPGSGIGGSSGGGGVGSNMYVPDQIFEAMLDKARKPAPLDPERNIEKRLEMFHTYGEENAINYDLNQKERQRLKIRQQVHEREMFYAECARSIKENSPKYIQENYHARPEQLVTIEQSLSSRHLNNDKELNEDELPEQIKPTRVHPVGKFASTDDMIRHPNRMRGDEEDKKPGGGSPYAHTEDPTGFWEGSKSTDPATVPMTTTNTGKEVENYQSKKNTDNWGGQDHPYSPTLAFDYPNHENFSNHAAPRPEPEPSAVPDQTDPTANQVHSTGLTLEQKTRRLKKMKQQERLPSDPYDAFMKDNYLGKGNRSPAEQYGQHVPDVGNNPMQGL